jgi:hypothetical protein
VNEQAMRDAVATLNRLIDEAAREGWKVEVGCEAAYHWVGVADCPRVVVTVSRPIKL